MDAEGLIRDGFGKPPGTIRDGKNLQLCTLCLKLEDEFHVLLECPLYKDLRNKYVNKYYIPKYLWDIHITLTAFDACCDKAFTVLDIDN